jgi:hypothetical protein
VAACAPAPPERLRNPKRIPHPEEERSKITYSYPTLVPRPFVDLGILVPDFHDELRWPLTPMNHPAMEPKFPIAQAFAQPGVGWLDLCGSGITNRYGKDKELLSYLRGWCKAVDGDTDAACSNLVPLIKSTTPRLEVAVRNDLANILAQGHADKAEHYIRVHSIRDVGLLDLLAANYVEVGTAQDALAINRNAIDSDDYANAETKCMRWTRHIVLSGDKSSLLIKQIEGLAKQPKNADPTCVTEYAKLTCWATEECAAYVHELGGVLFDAAIFGDLANWDRRKISEDWWRIADTALLQLKTPHAPGLITDEQLAEIAIAAMVNGRRVAEVSSQVACNSKQKQQVNDNAWMLRPAVRGSYAQWLDELEATCK